MTTLSLWKWCNQLHGNLLEWKCRRWQGLKQSNSSLGNYLVILTSIIFCTKLPDKLANQWPVKPFLHQNCKFCRTKCAPNAEPCNSERSACCNYEKSIWITGINSLLTKQTTNPLQIENPSCGCSAEIRIYAIAFF